MTKSLPNITEFKSLIFEGKKYCEIADIYNISRITVARLSRRYSELDAEIKTAIRDNISKRTSVNNTNRPHTVRNRKISKEDLTESLMSGALICDIAKKFGVSRRTIYNTIKHYGIALDDETLSLRSSNLSSARSNNTRQHNINTDRLTKMVDMSKTDDARHKLSESMRTRMSDPALRLAVSESSKKRWLDQGYRNRAAAALASCPKTLTKPHAKVCGILDSIGVQYTNEHVIGPWTFDIYVASHNILIEVQGTYFHSRAEQKQRDAAKSTYIGKYFPNLSVKYILEHECSEIGKVEAKLKYWFGMSSIEAHEYDLDDVIVRQIDNNDEVDAFLYNWHYQHHGRHGINIGAYVDNVLVSVARFTPVMRMESATSLGYKHNEVLELSRLCVHPKYHKKNLLSWFLSRCCKHIVKINANVKCLISFADSTYNHTGAVYKASNWKFDSIAGPDYHYVDSDGWVKHKKTLWNEAKKNRMSEKDYAELFGYVKSYGREKFKFIKILR